MTISHTNILVNISNLTGLQPANDLENGMLGPNDGFINMVESSMGKVDITLNEADGGGDDTHIVKCTFSIGTNASVIDISTDNKVRAGGDRTDGATIHGDIMCNAYQFSGEVAPTIGAINQTFTAASTDVLKTEANDKTAAEMNALRDSVHGGAMYINVVIDDDVTTENMRFYEDAACSTLITAASSSNSMKMMAHMLHVWTHTNNNLGTAMQTAMNTNADHAIANIMSDLHTSVMVTPHVLDSISNGSPLEKFGVLLKWSV